MRVAGAVVVALALAACGDGEPPDAGVPRATLDRLHAEATRREGEGDLDAPALRRAVEAVRAGGAAHGSPERQTVLTAWMTDALDGGRVEEARRAHRALLAEAGGEARYPDGSQGSRPAVAAGLVSASAAEARRRAEGDAADRASARRALEVADEVLRAEAVEDPEAVDELAAARRWVSLEDAAALGPALAPHDGPRIVVLAEDFALGDAVLASVLGRWAEEGASGALRVGVVPIRTGHVRRGLRREAATPEEEERSLARRIVAPVAREPGAWRPADGARLGLPPLHVGILAFDRQGRLAARLSGLGVEPRALDAVVQRLASR